MAPAPERRDHRRDEGSTAGGTSPQASWPREGRTIDGSWTTSARLEAGMHPSQSLIAATVAAAALTALAISPVAATYPGRNGRLAFGVRGPDGVGIVSVRPNGKDATALTSGEGFHACAAYSADGSKIAYCGNAGGPFEISSMNADGSNDHQVTNLGGFAVFPDYSPD